MLFLGFFGVSRGWIIVLFFFVVLNTRMKVKDALLCSFSLVSYSIFPYLLS